MEQWNMPTAKLALILSAFCITAKCQGWLTWQAQSHHWGESVHNIVTSMELSKFRHAYSISVWESLTSIYVKTHSDNKVGKVNQWWHSSNCTLHKSTPTKLYCFDLNGTVVMPSSNTGSCNSPCNSGVDLMIRLLLWTVWGKSISTNVDLAPEMETAGVISSP